MKAAQLVYHLTRAMKSPEIAYFAAVSRWLSDDRRQVGHLFTTQWF